MPKQGILEPQGTTFLAAMKRYQIKGPHGTPLSEELQEVVVGKHFTVLLEARDEDQALRTGEALKVLLGEVGIYNPLYQEAFLQARILETPQTSWIPHNLLFEAFQ